MKALHLTPGFAPVDLPEIQYKTFLFSGGEVHIQLNEAAGDVLITARLNSSDDVMRMLLAVDALRRAGAGKISAFMPYLPYARQDRVMVDGEPLSIRVMTTLLNSCGFHRIYVYDVHSEVSLALLDNVQLITNESLVRTVLKDKKDYLLVSPDAGALKKIYKLATALQYTGDIVLCNKIRDVRDGAIKRVDIDCKDLQGKECFIVDDICDGGTTFVGVAKELKGCNAGNINLIVSHGIFSRGEAPLVEYLDHVYTTDSFREIQSSLITTIPLAELIHIN